MKKFMSVVLVVLTLISSMSFAISAVDGNEGIMPCYNNTNKASVTLTINSSGLATVSLDCIGISGRTTKIVAESKIERKWGLLWLDVDAAEWTDSTTNYYMTKSHKFQLTKTGTYRVTATYTVSGSGGVADSITTRSQYVY